MSGGGRYLDLHAYATDEGKETSSAEWRAESLAKTVAEAMAAAAGGDAAAREPTATQRLSAIVFGSSSSPSKEA